MLWNQKAALNNSRHCYIFYHNSVTSNYRTSRRYRLLRANGESFSKTYAFLLLCLLGF